MAVNRTPVLKRCRSLDLDPVYLGIDKKSRRKAKNAGRKISEYGTQGHGDRSGGRTCLRNPDDTVHHPCHV